MFIIIKNKYILFIIIEKNIQYKLLNFESNVNLINKT